MAVSDFLKKFFPKSLWVYHLNTGACNGCDIEVINVLKLSTTIVGHSCTTHN